MDEHIGGVMVEVTVIVPVYNVELYLKKCLDSLINQTLEDIQIIVVNDGSPDKSQDIIDEYVKKYPGKMLSFEKENGGQGSARNLALQYATGEYVGFVDSDDWVDENMYKNMYGRAVDTAADIVICNTIDHYCDYEVYHRQSDVGKLRKCGSVCNKIFKREFLGPMCFPSGLWYEDFSFGVKLLMKTNKVSYCEGHYYHALNRQESTMNNNNALKNLDMIVIMEDIINYAKTIGAYTKHENDLEYMFIEHILITSINRVSEQKNSEKRMVIRKLRNYVKGYYPHFYKDSAFREFNKKQRVIAILNANGLENVSKTIFKFKRIFAEASTQ